MMVYGNNLMADDGWGIPLKIYITFQLNNPLKNATPNRCELIANKKHQQSIL